MVESRFPCIVKHVKAEAVSLRVKEQCREEVILVRNGYRKTRCCVVFPAGMGDMLEALSSNRGSQFISYSFIAAKLLDHQPELTLHTVLF